MGPRSRSGLLAVTAVCALTVSVAACSSSSSSSSSSKSSAPASSAPAASASASASAAPLTTPTQKEIAANWTEFFNPKAPPAKRLALLQNASQFTSAMAGMAKNPQAATSSSKVDAVTVVSSSDAKVTYDILVSGTPALKGQAGEAVKQGGTWKVSDKSFCALLAMQNGGKTSGLPAACKSAS